MLSGGRKESMDRDDLMKKMREVLPLRSFAGLHSLGVTKF